MDPRLLHYYNLELKHLQEMGAEFAREFPRIAARLGMNGLEVADPYVERLLEGVGFLAARVQLKLDAEFPRFTQALLEIIYPHYLSPTPSMLVAKLQPDMSDPSLATGSRRVPRGTAMHSTLGAGDKTPCEFSTAQDVTLWPVAVESASYFSFAPDLPLNTLPIAKRIKGGLRLRLKTAAGLKFRQLSIDRLPFYFTGRDDVANKLHELCLATGLGVLVRPVSAARPQDPVFLPATSIQGLGFSDGQALLPVTLRSFQGYRLLQEYFAFPQRYRFMELTDLARGVKRADAEEIEIVVLLGRGEPTLQSIVDATNVALFCTPAINLFRKPRIDRIHVTDSAHEFHVVADRTRPLDFEIYQVTGVRGHGAGDDSEQQFLPLYSASSSDAPARQSGYFTTRREPRVLSEEHKRDGFRSSYAGTEVFLALVDPGHAPYSADLRQLSIQALCTNRDLVLQMPINTGTTDLSLSIAAPVKSVRVVGGPSRPQAMVADGASAWRAISHLSLNYLSLVNSSSQEGAQALRDLCELYATDDVSAKRQIEGIRSVKVDRMVCRLPDQEEQRKQEKEPGRLAFGRGLRIELEVDELAFEGGSAFILGAVLEHYFARCVSINSVTETVLRSQTRGEIGRWTPHWGTRPTL
jgi:type VI secretion system protein ImpG